MYYDSPEEKEIARLERELATVTADRDALRKDKELLDQLIEEAGSFYNDSFVTITISGDDATRTWHVSIGTKTGFGGSIRSAIRAALDADMKQQQ